MSTYEVIVGNVGTVYSGRSELDARKVFKEYEAKSITGTGRAGGEEITMLKDGEEYRSFQPRVIAKNPSRRKVVKKVTAVRNPSSRRGEVDEHAARELALYAENDEPLYRRLQAFAKNYALKMKKGTFSRERAIDGLEGMVGDVYRQYCKEFGRFACSAATKRHAAEILLESVEHDAKEMSVVKKNPSIRSIVKKISPTAAKRVAKKISKIQPHLVSIHKKLKKNPLREGPDKAGGMAAFEHDVVSNPHSSKAKSEILRELKEYKAQLKAKSSELAKIKKARKEASAITRAEKKSAKRKPSVKMNPRGRMSMAEFIKEHKEVIDSVIKSVSPNTRLNDKERRMWIMNDEGLYRWARSSGVSNPRKSSVKMNPRGRMSMAEFIKEHKAEIDAAIKRVSDVRLNDKERRMWIMNDEGLYRWARSSGVRI